MSMEHTQKKRFIDKEIYRKSSYGRDFSSELWGGGYSTWGTNDQILPRGRGVS